jgi:predicted dithiol-disulfide oxidoreductase (DUF899 family)
MNAMTPDGGDDGIQNVFVRDGDVVRRAWSSGITQDMADPGEDGRGAPDPSPLWQIFDMTPEGRAPDWYPKLSYAS